jgi:hypothetical protein
MSLQLAVAGAHLSGLSLNYQLLDLGAKLVRTVRTAPVYSECFDVLTPLVVVVAQLVAGWWHS